MALLDICLTEGDSLIIQEQSRGNSGIVNDINPISQISEIIPSTSSVSSEHGFAYIN